MWVWIAMADLRVHVLQGESFHVLRGAILAPIVLAIVAITALSFFHNAVFAFAIVQPGVPQVRPAFATLVPIFGSSSGSGAVVGPALALATTVVTRWGRPSFAIVLGIVVGVMMVATLPSRRG